MRDDELLPLINDPDLVSAEACKALLALARASSGGDPDRAGDIVLHLTERLRPGRTLRERLATHRNPAALLKTAARNGAQESRDFDGAQKRVIPLTLNGEHYELEPEYRFSPSSASIFDVLERLGWTQQHLEILALPRKRAGRSIHPGIEDAIERLARCFGVTERCDGCPSPNELQRMSLVGPDAWPALVPVLIEWGWSEELIRFITGSPANIAHWRGLPFSPPARQETRMVKIAFAMRFNPALLTDADAIRACVRPTSDPRELASVVTTCFAREPST